MRTEEEVRARIEKFEGPEMDETIEMFSEMFSNTILIAIKETTVKELRWVLNDKDVQPDTKGR